MLGQQIEAVFENGVFRPLQPVHLPEHHRVTLLLPAPERTVVPATNDAPIEEEQTDQEVGYLPLPLQQCRTVRVRLRHVGDLAPLPYPIEDEIDAVD